MALIISENIRAKLQAKHEVSPKDVFECLANRTGKLLLDTSEERRDPPTHFFIAPNNHGRLLLVAFVVNDKQRYLRTCFEPSAAQLERYRVAGQPTDF